MRTTPKLIETSSTSSSDDNRADLILPEHVHIAWPVARPLLAPAIAQTGGRLSPESVLSWLCAGQLQLWLTRRHDAAMVTEIRTYPTGMRVLHIVVLGGNDRNSWLHLQAVIARWAAERGCIKMEMAGRKGWVRTLPDWTATKISMEKDIVDV